MCVCVCEAESTIIVHIKMGVMEYIGHIKGSLRVALSN